MTTTILPGARISSIFVPDRPYHRGVIKLLYRFIRDRGYESVNGEFVRRET